MAKWRALHASISTSEDVAELTEFEQLLFTWMIPHADDWGILTGNPLGIRMKVIPATNRSLEEIDEALTHIADAGLIWRYEADGHGQLVQFRKWAGFQPIRADRLTDAKYPAHDGQMPTSCQPDDNQAAASDGLHNTTTQDKTEQDTRLDNNTAPNPALVAVDVSDGLILSNTEYLQEMGVVGSKRSELAALPWVNSKYLDAWTDYLGRQAAKGKKLGAGFLVKMIESGEWP